MNTEGEEVAANVDELHSEKNKISVELGRSENGRRIPGRLFVVNQHDILTGSAADGAGLAPGERHDMRQLDQKRRRFSHGRPS